MCLTPHSANPPPAPDSFLILKDNPCLTTWCIFRSFFPFSWFVIGQLDKLRRNDSNDVEGSLEASFLSSPVGQIVAEAINFNDDAIIRFILDLVVTKFGPSVVGSGLNVICEEVLRVTKGSKTLNFQEDLTGEADANFVMTVKISPVDVFETVAILRPRIQLCVAAFDAVKNLADRVEDLRDGGKTFNLDLITILAAFEVVEPVGSEMIDMEAKAGWSEKVTVLLTRAKQLEGLVAVEDLSDEDRNRLEAIRMNCQRLEMLKLFFDRVLQSDVNLLVRETVCQNLRLLLSAFKSPDFFSSPITFKNLKFAIDSCCRKVGEAFLGFKGVQECIVCLENIRMPVTLPCGHVGCSSCLKDHFRPSGRRVCPKKGCKDTVPDDFSFQTDVDVQRAVEEHARFRQKLTQFFTELLQRFVFVPEKMPHQDVVNDLLSLIVTKELPKDDKKPRTKQLSPFPGDFIDARPVVRSFLLQLLLRYNVYHIEPHLQKFLDEKLPIVEQKSQFPDLCVMIIQCLEDSITTSKRQQADGRQRLESVVNHLTERVESGFDPDARLVRSLINTAKDRLALNAVGQVVIDILGGDAHVDASLAKAASNFVRLHPESANVRNYLVRFIATKSQQSAVVDWKRKGVLLDLLPDDIRNTPINESPDFFLTLDRSYKQVRDTLVRAWISDDYKDASTAAARHKDNTKIFALAFHQMTKINPCNPKNEDTFADFLSQHVWLRDLWLKNRDSHQNLVDKSHRHSSILGLLIHLRSVLNEARLSPFLQIFRQLLQNPEACLNLFLPTMPQDETLEAKAAVKDATTWYQCPNGHTYAIGNCGQPVEGGNCPSCKVPVGGAHYAFAGTGRNVQQVQQAQLADGTKPGYILGPARADAVSTTVREISGLAVAITRFFLHSAMLEGTQTNPDGISQLVQLVHDGTRIGDFLTKHLLLNLRHISESLGRSESDAIILLHQIVESFGKAKATSQGHWVLGAKQTTRDWENEFFKNYIDPALKNLDQDVARHRVAVKEDKEEASSVLQGILFEDAKVCHDRAKILSLPQIWFPRENVTLERIESKVGGPEKFKQNCPVLFHLLRNENVLKRLCFLPQLLRLADFMVTNFNRKLESAWTDETSVNAFLQNSLEYSDQKFVKPLVKVYFSVLNQVKAELFGHNW